MAWNNPPEGTETTPATATKTREIVVQIDHRHIAAFLLVAKDMFEAEKSAGRPAIDATAAIMTAMAIIIASMSDSVLDGRTSLEQIMEHGWLNRNVLSGDPA